MKSFITLILFNISFCNTVVAQSNRQLKNTGIKINVADQIFNNDHLYLVCRASTEKSGLIAKQFNLRDTLITHVGIGLYSNGKSRIFHISNEMRANVTAFTEESPAEFLQNKNLHYACIWKVKITEVEYKKAIDYINSVRKNYILFDYDFSTGNGNKLYCSEFCANTLMYINSEKFVFMPVLKQLEDAFIISFLGRKTLLYYPVDFFLTSSHFTFAGVFNLAE